MPVGGPKRSSLCGLFLHGALMGIICIKITQIQIGLILDFLNLDTAPLLGCFFYICGEQV